MFTCAQNKCSTLFHSSVCLARYCPSMSVKMPREVFIDRFDITVFFLNLLLQYDQIFTDFNKFRFNGFFIFSLILNVFVLLISIFSLTSISTFFCVLNLCVISISIVSSTLISTFSEVSISISSLISISISIVFSLISISTSSLTLTLTSVSISISIYFGVSSLNFFAFLFSSFDVISLFLVIFFELQVVVRELLSSR